MPYKDINKRRETIRKSVAKLRARKKGLTAEEIEKLTQEKSNRSKNTSKKVKALTLAELTDEELLSELRKRLRKKRSENQAE